ncbi:unnamed protein product [Acanthosepion pharaonis]|uniref:Uncharacterized protein n=1 Tax=Acanthosepion pharaonis TaxID=158019 RepID=A0A812BUA4_ACAPH|nr:unnamed protein product [Sepia pharaonis]
MIFILHQLDTKSIKSGQYDHETKCRLNSIGDRSGIRTTLATTILCRTLVTDRTTTTSEELLTNANRLNDRALNNVFPPCRSLFICVSWAVSLFSQPRAFSVSPFFFSLSPSIIHSPLPTIFILTALHVLSDRHPTRKTHEMAFSLSRDTSAVPYPIGRPMLVLYPQKLRSFVVFPNPLVFSTNSRFNCLPRNAMPTAFDRWPLPLLFRADFEYLTSLLLSALTETKPIF